MEVCVFFFSSRRRHTGFTSDWSSDVCSSDLDARIRLSVLTTDIGRRFAGVYAFPKRSEMLDGFLGSK